MLAKKSSCPIIPIYMDELWGSIFSYSGNRFFSKAPLGLFGPLGEAVLGHLALSGQLHDIEGQLGFQPLVEQIGHDAVAAADHVGNGADPVANQILGVAVPYVGAETNVRKKDLHYEIL